MHKQPACTKIVATVGPASETPEMIGRLIEAGVDVFRLNFSHGDHETHFRAIETIRKAAGTGHHVAIMQDLQGPRIRTGLLKSGRQVELKQGDTLTLQAGNFAGDGTTIAVNYDRLARDLRKDDRVLLCDGLIELCVVSSDATRARCRVIAGGMLGEHKGINLPGVKLSISAPTEKDIQDLRFGLDNGVDYVALSFVGAAGDVNRLKEEMADYKGHTGIVPVIVKIERPEAIDRLEEILAVSDGVMVARGDLGIEVPAEIVPVVQKRIIRTANEMGLPVITATQMLDSMIRAPRPTRAEASDVANAILDGTDAVMLSGETSVGSYPEKAVRMMNSIAATTEELLSRKSTMIPPYADDTGADSQRSLSHAACTIAEQIHAAAIVCFTMTGSTACSISQRRPPVPIYALTPDGHTCCRLSLLWGVCPVMLSVFHSTDEMIQQGERRLLELNLTGPGDTVVCVAGGATNTPGGTDMLKIHRFPG